jgi:hypothetical protein
MLPPDVQKHWNDNTPATQAMLLAYEMIRDYEEQEQWQQKPNVR